MELTVEIRREGTPVVHITVGEPDSPTVVADALALGSNAGADSPIWLHGSTPANDQVFTDAGFHSDRTLLQMRASLPTPRTDLPTRAFTESDIEEFVEVNNRAFAWHPEQSGLTEEQLRRDMAAPWFDPDGFRLHHVGGRLAGFCWTKVHDEPERLGEIYVIAIDPDFSGRGLGRPMTQAGLDWIADQGLEVAMLFVESDNAAAVATYTGLGFSTHRTDKLWRRR